jgi:hypothetical protein
VSLSLFALGIAIEHRENLPEWWLRMHLLAAIWIPAVVAALVGLVGLFFAKREREEAERHLESLSPITGALQESVRQAQSFAPRTPKASPS